MVCKICGNPATTAMSLNDGPMGIVGNTQAYLCNDCHLTVMKQVRKEKNTNTAIAFGLLAVGALIAGAFALCG